jgi:prepilin-type N-terminal cleavage/methylation domain-containing protein
MNVKRRTPRNGFTLIEVVIALGLMAALVLMCGRLASANLQLANGIGIQQKENTIRESFFDLLKMQFANLPGNARMKLTFEKSTKPYLYSLILQNVPTAFTWGGSESVAKAVEITTVKQRDGMLRVVMRYYENEIISDEETIASDKEKPFAEISLIDDLRFFEWRVLDGRQGSEWQEDWDLQGRMPLKLELVTAQGAYGDEIRQIFWIVPKVSPQQIIRNMGGGGGQAPGGGVPGGGQGPGGGINIDVPNPGNGVPAQ